MLLDECGKLDLVYRQVEAILFLCYKFLVKMSAPESGAGMADSVEVIRRVTGRDPIC